MKKINKSTKQKRSSTDTNLIKLRVLTTKKEFLDDVQAIRKHVGLPPNGLSFEKERAAEYDAWFKKIAAEEMKSVAVESIKKLDEEIDRQMKLHKAFPKIDDELLRLMAYNTHRMQELIKSQPYQSLKRKYDAIKSQLNPAALRPEYRWEREKEIVAHIPENVFNDDVDILMQWNHLPASFKESIEHYIKFNKISRSAIKDYVVKHDFSVVWRWVDDEQVKGYQGNVPLITVQIFRLLKSREMDRLAEDIKKLQREVFPAGLLKNVRSDMNIEKMVAVTRAASDAQHTAGRPKKTEEYMTENNYVRLLRKNGRSEAEIKKIMKMQVAAGEHAISKKKIKLGTTSDDVAKEILRDSRKGSQVRSAAHKAKELTKRLFPQEQ